MQFWAAIAQGVSSEDAALAIGVSSAVGARWFRHAGGVNPCVAPAVSGRYLSFAEGEDIAIWDAQKIACGRSLVGSGGRRRRSLVSCGAMRRLGHGGSSTGRRRRSGTPSAALDGRRQRSWSPTSVSATTCRTAWRAWSEPPTKPRCPVLISRGRAATSLAGKIGGGDSVEPGADRQSAADRLPR